MLWTGAALLGTPTPEQWVVGMAKQEFSIPALMVEVPIESDAYLLPGSGYARWARPTQGRISGVTTPPVVSVRIEAEWDRAQAHGEEPDGIPRPLDAVRELTTA